MRELHELLRHYAGSEQRYKDFVQSMRNSTLTAFYTPPAIVRALAETLRDAGIVPRRLLDPSAGAGIFPSSFRETADGEVEILSFEKDLLTGQVLSALAREREQVVIDGFQTIESAYDDYFDVVTSNIPFGDTRIFDTAFRKSDDPVRRQALKAVHNYFFIRGLDTLREGGILAFVTSAGVMDAPGNFDFSGEAVSAIRAAECAVLVGAAKDGLSVGMERSWKLLGKKPRMIFVNRTDEDNSDYQACLDALKGKFGQSVVPIVAPVIDGNKKVTGIVDLLHNTAYEVKGGKAAACAIPADMADEVETLRSELMEAAAGSDEELMEKFFDTMELSAEDMARGLKLGVRDGSVCPVLCGSAVTGLGVEMLMQTILDLVPVATDMPAETAQDDDGNDVEVACDPNGPTAAIVFKTISDQYGKYSMVKVLRGRITSDMALYNPATGNTEKLGRLYIMKGKKGEEVKEICCGDIGAIGKMDKVKTGNTLCDPKHIVRLCGMDYAQPCYSRAISPKTKQEVEKLGTGLNKLNEEDPTFHVVNNAETHQTVISGAGDIQIDVLCSKLKTRFGVDAEAVLRHKHAGKLAGHAADVLARAHGGDVGGRIRRGDGVARPYAHLLQLAEDAVHNGEGDFLRQAAALVGLQDDRVGAHGAQRAGQRGGEGALVRVDPDELRAERADAGQKPLGFLRADAHLVQFALVARAGVKIQHKIRAAHILNHLMAHVFKRRAVRRAGEGAVHIQPRSGGNHAVGNIQTERVEHGVKIHRAAKRVRMFADALLYQIEIHHAVECIRVGGYALFNAVDDELTHHFVAVRARSDADAADGRTVGGVPAALDAPSLLDGQGDAGNRRQCLEQNDPLLLKRYQAFQRGCGMNQTMRGSPPLFPDLRWERPSAHSCTRCGRHRPFLRYDANTNGGVLQVKAA